MRVLAGLGVVILAVAACRGGGVIARDGDATLTAERVTTLAKQVKGQDPSVVAGVVVQQWVVGQSLGRAAAADDSLADSGAVRAVLEPALVEARLTRWLQTIVDRAVAADSGAYRARYANGQPMAARDAVFALPVGDSSAKARAGARRKAATFRGTVSRESFAARAKAAGAQYEDLGVFQKGRLAPELEKAILATRPGAISGVIDTPFGAHVVYRPTIDEVREAVLAVDRPATVERARSAYVAAVDSVGHTRLEPNAVTTVRAVVVAADAHRGDSTVIARTAVRDLTAARLVWWLGVFPPNMAGQVAGAPDSIVRQFVVNLVGYEVMLRSADSARVAVDSGAIAELRRGYVETVRRAWKALGVDPRALSGEATSRVAREKAAAQRVDAYVDSLFAPRPRVRVVALPPALERVARTRYASTVDTAALAEVVSSLRSEQRRADSVRDAKLPQSIVPIPQR